MKNVLAQYLVCFDLGGVLVRTCASFEEACDKSGLGIRDFQVLNLKRDERRAIAHFYHLGLIDTQSFLEKTSKCLLGMYSPDEVKAIHKAVVIEETHTALEAVNYAFSHCKNVAVLSNNNALHWSIVNQFPSVSKISNCYGSHILHLLKPARQIFTTFEKLTSTLAKDIIFFDDQPDNIAASKACGWNSFLVKSNSSILNQVKGVIS